MIIYLAGEAYGRKIFKEIDYNFNRLDSFFYVRKCQEMTNNIKKYNKYILDSGAFTFIMAKNNKGINIDKYTDEYIEFIKEHSIDLFFEMDVDAVYGYDKVKKLRKKIEQKTGKRAIPVFHANRGKTEWVSMCKDYEYISLGIAGKDVGWGDYKTFKKFVASAKEYDCKVHGLGITGMKSLENVPFYSVDSSSWTAGNRYKAVFKFDGKYCKTIKTDLTKKRIKNHISLAKHNLKQWIFFAQSMENKIIL